MCVWTPGNLLLRQGVIQSCRVGKVVPELSVRMMWNAMGQGVDRSRRARSLVLLLVCVLLLVTVGAEGKDLYKVLGVDKQASQADIKKAFHKLSLKYHPDKNPSKDAQAKFTEISNAYEVLSDEEKRTNYDAYGDPAGPQGPAGGRQGWHHPGGSNSFQFSGFNGPQFTFSYGGDGPRGHSNFGNVFETFFGGSRGSQGSDRQNPERSRVFDSMEGVETLSGVKSNLRQQVIDKSKLAWLLLFYNPSHPDLHPVASALKEVANSLRGMIKVAVIDCKAERHLCDTEGALPLEDAKAFVYPYGGSDAAQYFGGWTAKSLKNFVAKHLPRLSTRLDTENFIQRFADYHALPRVLLFTKKKETPNMWRALSGLYDNQVLFFDMQVDDESDPLAKRFDVKEFPAVVGVLANGKEILLAGRSDLEGTGFKFDNLKDLIMKLRKESKEGGPRQGGSHSDGHVPYLTKVNSGLVCGKDTPLCIITVVKNAKLGEKSEKIMNEVSRKTLVRQAESYGMKKAAISYGLVDASKQSSYLHAVFRNPKFSNSDTILLALKPRRKKFALFKGAFTLEEVESFVSGVLVGDIHFENYKEDPVLSV